MKTFITNGLILSVAALLHSPIVWVANIAIAVAMAYTVFATGAVFILAILAIIALSLLSKNLADGDESAIGKIKTIADSKSTWGERASQVVMLVFFGSLSAVGGPGLVVGVFGFLLLIGILLLNFVCRKTAIGMVEAYEEVERAEALYEHHKPVV